MVCSLRIPSLINCLKRQHFGTFFVYCSYVKNRVTHKTRRGREAFLMRTAKDTVVSFQLEGITITLEEAFKMAEDAASKAEKEGRLVLA